MRGYSEMILSFIAVKRQVLVAALLLATVVSLALTFFQPSDSVTAGVQAQGTCT